VSYENWDVLRGLSTTIREAILVEEGLLSVVSKEFTKRNGDVKIADRVIKFLRRINPDSHVGGFVYQCDGSRFQAQIGKNVFIFQDAIVGADVVLLDDVQVAGNAIVTYGVEASDRVRIIGGVLKGSSETVLKLSGNLVISGYGKIEKKE
jgi:hypothetical protein